MLTELVVAFGIVAICVVIHASGIVILGNWLLKRRPILARQHSLVHSTLLLTMVFAIITLLHVGETGIWALFYYWHKLFEDYETSLYFSLGSYTTIGYGDVVLPQRWRLLGAIEGASGVLLSGLSTAFIFAILNGLFQMRIKQQPQQY
ncbi:MAG: ion channel [Pyrinomonadaceae bacterium]